MSAHDYMRQSFMEVLTKGNIHFLPPESLAKWSIPGEINETDPRSVFEAFQHFLAQEPIEISITVLLYYGRIMGIMEITSGERRTVRKPAFRSFSKAIFPDGHTEYLGSLMEDRTAINIHNHPEPEWIGDYEKAKRGEPLSAKDAKDFRGCFYSHSGDYQSFSVIKREYSYLNCLLTHGYVITPISCCQYTGGGLTKFYTTDPELEGLIEKVMAPHEPKPVSTDWDDMWKRVAKMQRQQRKQRKQVAGT